jgi:hypothetical protein
MTEPDLADPPVRKIAPAASSAPDLLSRVLGFVRHIAWLFGAGMVADAFFGLPDSHTLREPWEKAPGGVHSAFARTIARDGQGAAWALASKVWHARRRASGSFAGGSPAGLGGPDPGARFAVPGKPALTAGLLGSCFHIFPVGLAALFMAILNSLGHFLAALSPRC